MSLPHHVAIIMDGNGRWARKRLLPRVAGHQQALESVRAVISTCVKKGIPCLTLFTFSSENWRRPESEVNFLFSIFLKTLRSEMQALHENNVRLKVVGDISAFSNELKNTIQDVEELTKNNTKLRLNIAFNYGGRWDILQAMRSVAKRVENHEIAAHDITETLFQQSLSMADCKDPDLFIRTSGEYRISNFLLWQLAYTELYFTDTYFPDFREEQFEEALSAFSLRNRRFGSIEDMSETIGPAEIDA